MFKYIDCIDAGTDYCPCSLAERGECIICSQLKDKVFCDCLNWKGTCIYQEFINNNEKCKKSRSFEKCEIVGREEVRSDLVIFDIRVNNTLARELNNVGAFVFLKNPKEGDYYSTPISIMESNIFKNIIKVAIKINGVKTKSLKECEDKIFVKGPYWNGIQGAKYIKNLKNKNCLIIARGVAAAPAVFAARKLTYNSNQVYVLLDPGRSQENFTKPYFRRHGCIVEDLKLCGIEGFLTMESKMMLERLIRKWNFKTIVLAGSDEFYRMTMAYIYNIDPYVNFATVNNSTMCCGEGICGSCQVKGNNKDKIKSCKQQYNPVEIFLEGMCKK